MKNRNAYQEYIPGQPLQTFFEADKIPLLQMRHLRDLDFPITRHISYERTVDEFLLQLAVNDVLLPLRNRTDMALLLDAQGALLREDGKWYLLFTPDCAEELTLAEDARLYPVLQQIIKKEKEGLISRIQVPERTMKTLISGLSPFCILDEFCKNQKGGYMTEAEKIVITGPDDLFHHVPVCRYGALATVDKEEVENYQTIRLLLDEYTLRYSQAKKSSPIRPLSIAVFGSPGSGKSFGVKQIALSLGHFALSSLNLSQYESPADLFEGFHEALQCEDDQIPLVFFDEFDSELSGTPRGWLKYFLAPMQDGEYTLNGRNHSIKGAVFVFAGATAYSFHSFLPATPEEEETFRAVKGTDFVSRLEGILNIKGPNPMAPTDRSHVIRRALLMREQIIRKSSGIYDQETGLVNISRGLLSSLLSVSEYRHGARSLEFILGMSRLSEVSRFTPSCLPVDEQLDIHLDVQDFRNRLAFEQMLGDSLEKYAMIAHEKTVRQKLREAKQLHPDSEYIEELKKAQDMAPWAELPEINRKEYYSTFYYIGVRLQDYHFSLGLRPIQEGAPDAISELYGPALEVLSELAHEHWILCKKEEGWRQGPFDPDLKTTPELIPYEEMDESAKEAVRLQVRVIPDNLRDIGYELYRKEILPVFIRKILVDHSIGGK